MESKNESSSKCLLYRDIVGTFLDLSVKKSPLTIKKLSKKRRNERKWGEITEDYYFKETVSTDSYTVSRVVVSRGWWRRGGSNPLPQRCQRCALPVELRPLIWTIQIEQAISPSHSFRLWNKMILRWLPKTGRYGMTTQWKLASPRGVEPLLPPWKGGVLGL